MNHSNVKLIFLREMRDQLRDRRTLFLIAVLPLLLYPLLGMSFFQLSQFLRKHGRQSGLVVGERGTDQARLAAGAAGRRGNSTRCCSCQCAPMNYDSLQTR